MTCARVSLLLLLLAGACGGHEGADDDDDDDLAPDAGGPGQDAGADAGEDAGPVDQAADCALECAGAPPEGATCFGSALTDGFGRLDGTLLAVQRPTDTQCAMPNDDHLIVQVLLDGAAYRMVVNVLSDGRNGTDTRIQLAEVPAALPSPAWAEGWHLDAPLDYVTTLDVHEDDFEPLETDALIERVARHLTLGAPISVYATSNDRPESAHLVHRNAANRDGAIVVDPTGALPVFLLFHFDGQVF